MSAGVTMYLVLLVAVGAARLVEMRLSRAHQRELGARGFGVEREPAFAGMVALHTGILIGAAVETVCWKRPFVPALGIPAAALFVGANALRLWVIRTMAGHWNVRIVDSAPLGVVTTGPFRFIRHPNYLAVFVELLALPLIHGAYVTALVGAALHVVVLSKRIALEEAVLRRSAAYREAMGAKPRFIPRWPAKVDRVEWRAR